MKRRQLYFNRITLFMLLSYWFFPEAAHGQSFNYSSVKIPGYKFEDVSCYANYFIIGGREIINPNNKLVMIYRREGCNLIQEAFIPFSTTNPTFPRVAMYDDAAIIGIAHYEPDNSASLGWIYKRVNSQWNKGPWTDWGQAGLTTTTANCCIGSPGSTLWVRAVVNNGCGEVGSTPTSYYRKPGIASPVSSAATAVGCSAFTANWAVVSGATGYRLDVSTVNTFATSVSGYNDLAITGTSHAVTGLTPGVTYYYRVRAVNECGVSSSSTVQTATLPAAVAGT